MARWWRRQRPSPAPAPPTTAHEPFLDEADVAEISARLDAVEVTDLRRRDQLLATRVKPLVIRRVPVRVVEPVPGLRTVRVRFADGTAIVGHGEEVGAAGILARTVRFQAVWVASYAVDDAGVHLRFARSRRDVLISFLATGFDQPE